MGRRERETKRDRFIVVDGEESDESVEAEEEQVRIHRRSRRDLFSLHDSQVGPKLVTIRGGESIVCSTGGGKRRIVDRWRDKETSQDLLQEWTGSTRFRMCWEVLSDQKRSPAQCDFSRDVNGDIIDHFAAKLKVEPRRSKRSARNNVVDPQEASEACLRIWYVHTVLYSTMSRSGACS